jgi:hypothetical protein
MPLIAHLATNRAFTAIPFMRLPGQSANASLLTLVWQRYPIMLFMA